MDACIYMCYMYKLGYHGNTSCNFLIKYLSYSVVLHIQALIAAQSYYKLSTLIQQSLYGPLTDPPCPQTKSLCSD